MLSPIRMIYPHRILAMPIPARILCARILPTRILPMPIVTRIYPTRISISANVRSGIAWTAKCGKECHHNNWYDAFHAWVSVWLDDQLVTPTPSRRLFDGVWARTHGEEVLCHTGVRSVNYRGLPGPRAARVVSATANWWSERTRFRD